MMLVILVWQETMIQTVDLVDRASKKRGFIDPKRLLWKELTAVVVVVDDVVVVERTYGYRCWNIHVLASVGSLLWPSMGMLGHHQLFHL